MLRGTDDGVGVNEEELSRLFERFYRADHARASRGTGLGLAIVKHIVGQAGGTVEARGGKGAGLEIRCVLPVAASDRCPRSSFTSSSPFVHQPAAHARRGGRDTPVGFMTVTTPRIDSGKLGELAAAPDGRGAETVFAVSDLRSPTAGNVALEGVDMDVRKNFVTAFIGPSGCGKSTFIRCFNRMNDLVPGARIEGQRALPRSGPLRLERRPRRGAAADRDGLPEAEPVSEVDLRQHRLRPARPRDDGRTWTSASSARCATPPSGTRSRTGSRTTRSASQAASSSACASRGRSPSSPT